MLKERLKTIATHVAISFCYGAIFVIICFILFDNKINYYASVIDTIVVKLNTSAIDYELSYNREIKRLINYPSYGDKYGNVKIPKLDVDAPLFYGDSLSILRYGVGHYAGSYFPGEGGTIILAAHNARNLFGNILELEKGDIVTIEANYGTFKYKVDYGEILEETEIDASFINHDEEKLIMYTCYPSYTLGRKTKRFVVYASLVGEEL